MGKPLQEIRILLVQAREDPGMAAQELTCFEERCRLDRSRFVTLNVVHRPVTVTALEGVDAVMIGGAGKYSAIDDHPWTPGLQALLHEAYDRALPTFGSCWGHQVIARTFGGRVVYDAEKTEIGCKPVHLTEKGRHDSLFRDFPHTFRVNMGHHDRVVALPPGAVELAYSDTQPHQSFRLGDRAFYGTQFHSELDADRTRERLAHYRAYYREVDSEEEYHRIMDELADTTEVDHLLHDFLLKFVVHPDSASGSPRQAP